MAACEDQAEQIVVFVIPAGLGVGLSWRATAAARAWLARFGRGQQRELLLPGAFSAEPVDRLAPSRGGQPAAWVRRHALRRPVFESLHEGVLHQLLGETDIAEPRGERGPDPGRLLPVDLLQLVGAVHTDQSVSRAGARDSLRSPPSAAILAKPPASGSHPAEHRGPLPGSSATGSTSLPSELARYAA